MSSTPITDLLLRRRDVAQDVSDALKNAVDLPHVFLKGCPFLLIPHPCRRTTGIPLGIWHLDRAALALLLSHDRADIREMAMQVAPYVEGGDHE